MTREDFYNVALFQGFLVPLLAPGATVGGPVAGQLPGTPTSQRPFNIVSRETIEVQRVPPALQPVLFMDEAIEEYLDQGRGLTKKKVTVYFHIGATSAPGTAAGSILNPLIDLLEDTLEAPNLEPNLGLGDMIERAQFAGISVKNFGQNNTDPQYRQAVVYMPFEIVFI